MNKEIKNETGSSNQDSQISGNLENQVTDLNLMTDEELIDFLAKCDFSMAKVSQRVGKFDDYSRRIFISRKINYHRIILDHRQSIKNNYLKTPSKCQHCGKELDWEHRNNKYCCRSCAASENNKGKVKNPKGINGGNKKEYSREDRRCAQRHNKILEDRYHDLEIPKIDPGCCPVCGEYHCTNKFCNEHNFLQLIGFVKHLGFNPKTIGTKDVFEEFNRVRELVFKYYWIDNLSIIELGKIFNYSEKFMPTNILDNLNIPRRDYSESQTTAILENRKNIISSNSLHTNQAWHKTWSGQDVFLRSSYELDYANELDKNNINYQVESLRIEYYDSTSKKNRVAIPDFYLPDTNEIVEIKSDFTLDVQEMVDKFNRYIELGYTPKLILEHEEIDLFNIKTMISENRLKKIIEKNYKIIL